MYFSVYEISRQKIIQSKKMTEIISLDEFKLVSSTSFDLPVFAGLLYLFDVTLSDMVFKLSVYVNSLSFLLLKISCNSID